jgi:hypothetical protein
MLKKDFVDNARWITHIFQWFSWFKHEKTLIKDCKRSGWLSTDLNCEGTVHTKWLTTITTGRLCNVWGNNGRTRTSWFVMTICLMHTALSVPQFLTAKNMTVLSYPPYLNWHPVVYSCFQEWNHSYKGTVSRMYLVWELYSFLLKNVSRPSYYVVW